MNQQQGQYLAETARSQPSQKPAGGTQRNTEILVYASLKEAMISEDLRPMKYCKAMITMQAQGHCSLSSICTLSKYHMSSHMSCLNKHYMNLPQQDTM